MKLKDYAKVAKFGDVVELAAPGHLRFVVYSNPYKVFVTTVWVEKVGDEYIAKDCWAHSADNPDLEVKLISTSNKTNMKITSIVKRVLDVDTRILVKAGYLNGDLALTEEGTAELLGLLFIEKKDELVKSAKEQLDENNA